MKIHTSRLKIYDSESMSACTSKAVGVRATEGISQDSARSFPSKQFRQLKASVENMVSGHGIRNLCKLVEGKLEPDELVNARSRASTSKRHLHLAHHRLA